MIDFLNHQGAVAVVLHTPQSAITTNTRTQQRTSTFVVLLAQFRIEPIDIGLAQNRNSIRVWSYQADCLVSITSRLSQRIIPSGSFCSGFGSSAFSNRPPHGPIHQKPKKVAHSEPPPHCSTRSSEQYQPNPSDQPVPQIVHHLARCKLHWCQPEPCGPEQLCPSFPSEPPSFPVRLSLLRTSGPVLPCTHCIPL